MKNNLPLIYDKNIFFRVPKILDDTLKRKAKDIGISTSELMRFLLRHVYVMEGFPDKAAILKDRDFFLGEDKTDNIAMQEIK